MLANLAFNIRFGTATNSSSTHSILIVDPASKPGHTDWSETDPFQFGWGFFSLVTPQDKADYVWTQVLTSVKGNNWEATEEHYLEACEILDYVPTAPEEEARGGYVDHDSVIYLPRDSNGRVHAGFARWLLQRVQEPDILIFGGNDNDPEPPEAPAKVLGALDTRFDYGIQGVTDYDTHWLLKGTFSDLDARLRIAKTSATVTASPWPELVDIKVTDSCGFGCKFCYQGSTPEGRHTAWAPEKIAEVVHALRVGEAAIGGGEPTEYPHLLPLVQALHDRGIAPNLTTRAPKALEPFRGLGLLHGVGISAESANVLRSLPEWLRGTDKPACREVQGHIIVGATSEKAMRKLFQACRAEKITALLLGYKSDGRGGEAPHPLDWIDVYNSLPYEERPSLGVDAMLATQQGREIRRRLYVKEKYLVPGEGNFSCYIDFVGNYAAAASYGDRERVAISPDDPVDVTVRKILTAYRTWNGTLAAYPLEAPEAP